MASPTTLVFNFGISACAAAHSERAILVVAEELNSTLSELVTKNHCGRHILYWDPFGLVISFDSNA